MYIHAGRGRHRQHCYRRCRGHQCNLHRSHDLRCFAQCRYGRLALAAWSYGAEAGPCLATQPARCVFIAQCPQQALAIVPGDTQSAIPSTGANSTARSNPDAISLRNCMICLYTARQPWICDFYHSY